MITTEKSAVQVSVFWGSGLRLTKYGIRIFKLTINNGEDHLTPILMDVLDHFVLEEISQTGIRIELRFTRESRPLSFKMKLVMRTIDGEFEKYSRPVSIMRMLSKSTEEISNYTPEISTNAVLEFKRDDL